MLLRAAVIYSLAVSTMLFAAVALWQRVELGARRHDFVAMDERLQRLQRDLDTAVADTASAKRAAEAAQDDLQRAIAAHNQAAQNQAKDQAPLIETVSSLTRERDAARAEAAALARKAAAAAEQTARLQEQIKVLETQLAEERRAKEEAMAARSGDASPAPAGQAQAGDGAGRDLATGAIPPVPAPNTRAAQPAEAKAEPPASQEEAPKSGAIEPSAASAEDAPASTAEPRRPSSKDKKTASKRRKAPAKPASEGSFFPF